MRLPSEIPAPAAPALVVVAKDRDLGGGFIVRRSLPTARRRMVGPFTFFDQMGPLELRAGQGLDVRPHPHIGLATVTYLFSGEVVHRDSLGSVETIKPGAVNWMTAGSGIVHSERTGPEVRAAGSSLSGIQLWVALPGGREEDAPSFSHTPAEALPLLEDGGVQVRLILGELYGGKSPVPVLSPLFYAAATLQPGARLPLSAEHEERAAYIAEGTVELAGQEFGPGTLLVFSRGEPALLQARVAARVLLLGGEPLESPRHIWWNFVSSSVERLRAAAADWEQDKFAKVPGETERIPLPHDPLPR